MEKNNLEKIKVGPPAEKTQSLWRRLGPGLITGAADDDPSGIATYSQTGARFGFQLAWLAAFTFPFMAIVQEMCARIGLVTGRGLAANIRLHFPRWVLYLCTGLLFAANSFNIGADLGAMSEATRLVFPGFNFILLVMIFALATLLLEVFIPYKQYVQFLKWLTFILFCYVLTAFVIRLDWAQIVRVAFRPTIIFNKEQLFIIAAIIGTTISPYLFFWQTSQEVEEDIQSGKTTVKMRQAVTTEDDIKKMRFDVWFGMFVSNLVMFFIIIVCGATLFGAGMNSIDTAAEAAQALRPLAGNFAYALFTLGIIGTGLLAIPVLAGSASYAFAESFHWKYGLNKKFHQARAFYLVMIVAILVGMFINFIGLDPIKALLYSALANAVIAPICLVLIILISGSKKIMGRHVNSPRVNFVGWLTIILVTLAAVAGIWSLF